jgi:hypothetical protein
MRPIAHLISRWQDRAALRAELELELTLRRRFDRLPQRFADRRALRAERRGRRHGPDEIDAAISRAWGGIDRSRR